MGKIGKSLLGDLRLAAGAAMIFALLPLLRIPLGWVAPVIIGFITLCQGWRNGLMVLLAASLPVLAWQFAHPHFLLLVSMLAYYVITWLAAGLLADYRSWRMVMEFFVAIGVVVILFIHLFWGAPYEFWTAYLTLLLTNLVNSAQLQLSPTDIVVWVSYLSMMASGIMISMVLVGTFIDLFLARWWQSFLFNPGGLGREFLQLRNGRILSLAALFCMVAVAIQIPIAFDFLSIVLLPFVIGGISLLHATVSQHKRKMIALIIFYTLLLFLTHYIVMILIVAGFVDSWYDIRQRFKLLAER